MSRDPWDDRSNRRNALHEREAGARGWQERYEHSDDEPGHFYHERPHYAQPWGEPDRWQMGPSRQSGWQGGGMIEERPRDYRGGFAQDRAGRYDRGSWPIMSSSEDQYYAGFGGDPDRNRSLTERRDRDQRRGHKDGPGSYERSGDRNIVHRASDEVASWFGDEHAAQRRQEDHRGRGPTGYSRSDERIRDDVNDRLTDDPGLDASDVTVSVENGEVTLDGRVQTRYQKRRAEDCLEHISGIRNVQNNLRVLESRSSGTR